MRRLKRFAKAMLKNFHSSLPEPWDNRSRLLGDEEYEITDEVHDLYEAIEQNIAYAKTMPDRQTLERALSNIQKLKVQIGDNYAPEKEFVDRAICLYTGLLDLRSDS